DRRIPENRQVRNRRDSFLEEFDLFTRQLRYIQKQSSKVASRTRERLDPSLRYRIAFQVHANDRDGARRIHCGIYRVRGPGEKNAALEADKLNGKRMNSVDRAAMKPIL